MIKLFRFLYRLLDKLIIVPISRIVYNIQTAMRRNGNFIDNSALTDGTGSALAGAIYNKGTMGNINGDFIQNYTNNT